MTVNYGSMCLERIDILNDSSIEMDFLSDTTGKEIGNISFQGVSAFLFQSILEDNGKGEPFHIIEFIVHKLLPKEVEEFRGTFGFEMIPESFLPGYRVEAHGSFIDISFFCKKISVDECTEQFSNFAFVS